MSLNNIVYNKIIICGIIDETIFISNILLIISFIPLILSIFIISTNTFILIEIPLLNLITFNFSINFLIDWISCLFIRTVIFISSIILIFRIYYIPKEELKLFCILLIIFILSIIILIIRNNLFIILLGWDGLGLSSYILVIYYQNYITAASGSITLLRNRVGDIIILISIRIIIISANWSFKINEEFSLLTIIFLILAACSKSAQYPFSAWLPIAIAAPTPISALVHSSTLVTAGIFIIIRTINYIHPNSILIIIIISRATTLYARISANWEQDLKKIVALSTLRQIAIIIFAISINSITIAFIHLIIHALFKSTIFLCVGIIIHESSYQDRRKLRSNYINTRSTIPSIIAITTISLIGFPFISGFFSKDVIIEKIISSKIECLLSIIIIISIGITASYSIRIIILSNKNLNKSSPDLINHLSVYRFIPIISIALISIIIGSTIMWFLNSEQLIIFPTYYKLILITIILLGVIIGILLSFQRKKFINIGKSAISIWFNHFTATFIIPKSTPLISLYLKNDKSWQEIYGPENIFIYIKNFSKIPELIKYTIIIISIILIIIPIIIII